jgi:glycosyltransferase involved in cell wall biosynthesis
MYRNLYPLDLGTSDVIHPSALEGLRLPMARELIARSKKFLVHSEFASQLARRDAHERDQAKIEVLPFGHPAANARELDESKRPVVATFGFVTPLKRIDVLIAAMEEVVEVIPDAELAIVGEIRSPEDERRYRVEIERRGLSAACTLTGRIDAATYRSYLSQARVAVQLRLSSHGESSGAVADCLAAGVPTIVTDLGSAHELPETAVAKVENEVTPQALAATILSLLRDPKRRQALSVGAQRYADDHTFAIAAETLFHALELRRPEGLREPMTA